MRVRACLCVCDPRALVKLNQSDGSGQSVIQQSAMLNVSLRTYSVYVYGVDVSGWRCVHASIHAISIRIHMQYSVNTGLRD